MRRFMQWTGIGVMMISLIAILLNGAEDKPETNALRAQGGGGDCMLCDGLIPLEWNLNVSNAHGITSYEDSACGKHNGEWILTKDSSGTCAWKGPKKDGSQSDASFNLSPNGNTVTAIVGILTTTPSFGGRKTYQSNPVECATFTELVPPPGTLSGCTGNITVTLNLAKEKPCGSLLNDKCGGSCTDSSKTCQKNQSNGKCECLSSGSDQPLNCEGSSGNREECPLRPGCTLPKKCLYRGDVDGVGGLCTCADPEALCGNGIVNEGEECDDGNQVNTDVCTNTCKNAKCGDGFKQQDEDCDDGNQNDDDACSNTCHPRPGCTQKSDCIGKITDLKVCEDIAPSPPICIGRSCLCNLGFCVAPAIIPPGDQCPGGPPPPPPFFGGDNAGSDGGNDGGQDGGNDGGNDGGQDGGQDSGQDSGQSGGSSQKSSSQSSGTNTSSTSTSSSSSTSKSSSSTSQLPCPRSVCGDGIIGATSAFDCTMQGPAKMQKAADDEVGTCLSGDDCSNGFICSNAIGLDCLRGCERDQYCETVCTGHCIKIVQTRARGTLQANANHVCIGDGQYIGDGNTTSWSADGKFGTGNALTPQTTSISDTWKGTLCAAGIGCSNNVESPFTVNIPQRTLTGELRFFYTFQYSCILSNPVLEECDDSNKNNNDGCSSACKLEFCGDATVQKDLRVMTLDEALNGQPSNRNLFEQCDNGSVCDNNLTKKCRNHLECGTGKCVYDMGKDLKCSSLCQGTGVTSSLRTSGSSTSSSRTSGGSSSSVCAPPSECRKCATCGAGIFNICDQDECLSLGPCLYSERLNLGNFFGVCTPNPLFCDATVICPSSSSSASSSSPSSSSSSSSSMSSSSSSVGSSTGSSLSSSRSSTGSSVSSHSTSSGSSTHSSVSSHILVSPPAPVVPVPPPPVSAMCGDGFLDQEEECDDGNRINEDACSNNCTLKRSSSSRVSSSRSSSRVSSSSVPRCGDGILTMDEECDDGNLRDFDGCSAMCLLEFGFCGDSILQKGLGEMCEPRLHDPSLPYACTRDCVFLSPYCGDGDLDAGEQCDLGQRNSDLPNALCRENCSLPRCGDGILDTREQCDDKNLLNGDGCDRYCRLEYSAPPLAQVFPPSPYPYPQPSPPVHPPVGDTGPATLAIMAAGASAGIGWVRRRRKV